MNLKIATVLALLFCLNIFAQGTDPRIVKAELQQYTKQLQLSKVMYPGDSKIDVTYYGLDLNITTNPNNLTGNVIIGIKADTSSLAACFLDLRDILTVDSILLNGSPAVYNHSNNKINVTLDRAYSDGEYFTLRVYYHGLPGSSGFGGFYFGSHSGTPVICVKSEIDIVSFPILVQLKSRLFYS